MFAIRGHRFFLFLYHITFVGGNHSFSTKTEQFKFINRQSMGQDFRVVTKDIFF